MTAGHSDRAGGVVLFDHYWRLRARLAERHGQACRVVARGSMNSILIEFEDGVRHVVSRYAVRRRFAVTGEAT